MALPPKLFLVSPISIIVAAVVVTTFAATDVVFVRAAVALDAIGEVADASFNMLSSGVMPIPPAITTTGVSPRSR